jgi:drug/metabolite transporter (DMT)-like permease
MNPLYFVISSAALWSIHVICLRFAAEKVPPELTTFVFTAISALVLGAIAAYHFNAHGTVSLKSLDLPKYTFLFVVGAGVSIALVDLFFSKSLAGGLPLNIAMPIFNIGGIILSAIGAYFIFGEKLSPVQLLGLLFGCFGIYLILRDMN